MPIADIPASSLSPGSYTDPLLHLSRDVEAKFSDASKQKLKEFIREVVLVMPVADLMIPILLCL
jgi:hypothetical protein